MVKHLLPQTQILRLTLICLLALFLGWLILSLVIEGRKVTPAEGSYWQNVSSTNNGVLSQIVVLLCLSVAISLWADSDQSSVVHSTALYTTIGCWLAWIILVLGSVVDAFKNRVVASVAPSFYSDCAKTTGAFAVIAFAILTVLMVHAMTQSCRRSPDERPQFQKFSIVMIIFILLGLILFAAASIAVENQLNGSGGNTTGAFFIVYGALFLLAFIPSATVRGGSLTNMIAFWLTFMIAVAGWSCLIFVGRVSADSDFGVCNTPSDACNIYATQAAASIIITVAETLLCIFIYLYSRDGGSQSTSSPTNQSSG